MNTERDQILDYNLKDNEKISKLKQQALTELIKIDHDKMVLNNKKIMKALDNNALVLRVENKIFTTAPKHEVIHDQHSILKEGRVALEFKQTVKKMSSKDTLEQNITKFEIKNQILRLLRKNVKSA